MNMSSHDVDAPDFECLDTEQVPERLRGQAHAPGNSPRAMAAYLAIGAFLGALFVQSEVVSWFRIQEMFRFQSFHMYGIIGSAVAVAAISVWLIKRYRLSTLHGELIEIPPKRWGTGDLPGARYWLGGTLFGIGWALLGACPGPVFALIGSGITVMIVALLAAMAGTWTYAALRPHLPH